MESRQVGKNLEQEKPAVFTFKCWMEAIATALIYERKPNIPYRVISPSIKCFRFKYIFTMGEGDKYR